MSRTAERSSSSTALSIASSVGVRERAAGRAAAVVDEDVDAAEGLQRAVDEPLEVGRVRARRRARRARRSAPPPARARRGGGRTSRRSRPRRRAPRRSRGPSRTEAPQTIAVRSFEPEVHGGTRTSDDGRRRRRAARIRVGRWSSSAPRVRTWSDSVDREPGRPRAAPDTRNVAPSHEGSPSRRVVDRLRSDPPALDHRRRRRRWRRSGAPTPGVLTCGDHRARPRPTAGAEGVESPGASAGRGRLGRGRRPGRPCGARSRRSTCRTSTRPGRPRSSWTTCCRPGTAVRGRADIGVPGRRRSGSSRCGSRGSERRAALAGAACRTCTSRHFASGTGHRPAATCTRCCAGSWRARTCGARVRASRRSGSSSCRCSRWCRSC